ncbi:DUF3152 domain-containing protein [Actinomadura parmotrematis]|uniref:DUF3152 domain-containing protein n=1 Tax=Actinomadura parmotrematis TaxID=2864039 RepID=UPI0027E2ADFD|nr:DUF3152 domain-containing protein [Actinomadura parmotrematis]
MRGRRGRVVVLSAVAGAAVLAAGAGAVALLPGDEPDRAGSGAGAPAASAGGSSQAPAAPSRSATPSPSSPSSSSSSPSASGPVVNGRVQPPRVRSPQAASGRYAMVRGSAAPPRGSRGPLVRYAVEVERGLPFKGADFAAQVQRVLNDPRSWGHGGRMRFQRVSSGPVRFKVALSSPALTDRMCAPLITGGELSCRSGLRSVINARRWGLGAATYGRDLVTYREYVINHEVGHALGHGHLQCPGRGRLAPTMVQQTKSLQGCRPNPWPFPGG